MRTILITGASGFIGSFLVEEALRQGFNVWAGIRASSSRRYLQYPDIHFLELDFAHTDRLEEQLSAHKKTHGTFDYIVHCAGVTKCIDKQEFERVNFLQTKNLVDLLSQTGMIPKQFIFISTLSVFGPIHETDFLPIADTDSPYPNTVYGQSKLKAEAYLRSLNEFPYVILRPTGVYGPREQDYFLMAKSIRNHLDFAVGFHRQDLTFVYVKDVVQAVFLSIEKGITRRAYFLSDGRVYKSTEFSDLIRKELGHPFIIRLRCPLLILKYVSLLAEWWARRQKKPGTFNSDKYHIMRQRNWQCDITSTIQELGYAPRYPLEQGVKETIEWYKEQGWL